MSGSNPDEGGTARPGGVRPSWLGTERWLSRQRVSTRHL